ncbi:ATP-binding protein [Micromonospora sp. RTP1Z1]|uniref:ATP-binding protein n=1 Tax=Micromonospora sp. RTP1Z1 TaxID=2994043 RepID=UPI0039B5D20D
MGDRGVLTLHPGRAGDQLVVEVADTGPGIPPELSPRIFRSGRTPGRCTSASPRGRRDPWHARR